VIEEVRPVILIGRGIEKQPKTLIDYHTCRDFPDTKGKALWICYVAAALAQELHQPTP
jgi:hypothetical protein